VRNKRNKITQAKTSRKARFPFKRNARKRQPIGMVDRNSQSSKQPIKRFTLLAVFVYATHAAQSIALRALRALRLDGNRA